MLVVDEEQRFGVKHKERIKQLRTQVDVLTLTATPIPRTLHMSMSGLRDMSIIATPPQDRRAIRVRVQRLASARRSDWCWATMAVVIWYMGFSGFDWSIRSFGPWSHRPPGGPPAHPCPPPTHHGSTTDRRPRTHHRSV